MGVVAVGGEDSIPCFVVDRVRLTGGVGVGSGGPCCAGVSTCLAARVWAGDRGWFCVSLSCCAVESATLSSVGCCIFSACVFLFGFCSGIWNGKSSFPAASRSLNSVLSSSSATPVRFSPG